MAEIWIQNRRRFATQCHELPLTAILVIWSLFIQITSAQVRIVEPPEAVAYVNNTIIEGATATFGAPYYGQKVEGEVLFFDTMGCTEDSYSLPPQDAKNNNTENEKSHDTPFIVMLRRGGCNFVTKVSIAQDKGATAVLVADVKGSGTVQSDITRIIVADDGAGKSVRIPSILLSDVDSSILIAAGDNALTELSASTGQTPSRTFGRGAKMVMIELVWTLPKDHAVQVDIWATPSSSESVKFLKDFAPFAKIFQHRIDFQPHYWLLSMSKNYHDMCSDESADFCAFDPDLGGKSTGKMVVEETVRQLCLWDSTHTVDGTNAHSGFYSQQWWDYMTQLPNACPHDGEDPDRRFGKTCSMSLMQALNVNTRQVEKCVKSNFNTHLAKELLNRAWSPSAILINKTRYNGPLDAELVARAICTAFIFDEDKCQEALKAGTFEAINSSSTSDNKSSKETLAMVAIVIFCLLACVAMVSTVIQRIFLPNMESRLEQSISDTVRKQLANQMNDIKSTDIKGKSASSFVA